MSPILGSIGNISVLEGESTVTSVSASDQDGDALSFSLSGVDSSLFSITAAGQLSFKSAPDFESPEDSDGDSIYQVTVSVSDGSLSDSETVAVNVTDALEGRVVDGPISGAVLTRSDSDLEAVTDTDGYYLLGPVESEPGLKITSVGGTDTFSAVAVPKLVMVGDIPSDGNSVASINGITTIIASAGSEDEKQLLLDGLGLEITVAELTSKEIWRDALAGNLSAKDAQRKNAQLSILLLSVQTVASTTGLSDAEAVAVATAKSIGENALTFEGIVDLSNSEMIRAVILSTLGQIDGATDISPEVLSSIAEALADTSTVLGDEATDPTSETAAATAAAAQSGLQRSIDGVLAGEIDIPSFKTAASTGSLFAGVPVSSDLPDTDGDGQVDTLDADDDGDGVRDGSDVFPLDPTESLDYDGDGIGDNADSDDDNDGALDDDDAFPFDANESLDTDNDGTGNNEDLDDDGDGTADLEDVFPLDPGETADADGDGIGNNADTDDDNDGVLDVDDAFPLDPSESLDTDGDGVGNRADNDDDNDGVADDSDAFPLDASESIDTDGDGIGNNSDPDDDGDNVLDAEDQYPLDLRYQSDSDQDGMPDRWELQFGLDPFLVSDGETDLDFDGLANGDEFELGTNPQLRDSDRDSLGDGFEFSNSGDPLDPRYELAVRSAHGCVTSDEGIQCWGNAGDGRTSPPTISNPRRIGVGAQHSCVISNGDVICWGANYNGEQNIPVMPQVDILAVGEQSVCAHSTVGNQTNCWGWNGNGETQAPELINPKQIDAGAQHYCAIDDEGVKCWGWNGNQEATPPELTDPTFVDAGRYSSCAIDQGQVICWGLQAGTTLPALSNPFDLAVGPYHSCALDEDGIKCWAYIPNSVDQAIITPPENLSNPVQIEAGDTYTCALHDGGVACWGDLTASNLEAPDSLFFDADDDTYSSQAFQDVFPEDSSEWLDTDGDDIGNNRDDDDDGDDVLDVDDAFPLDPAESLDTDADGVGNNADVDDDNDGVADSDDAFPLDDTESQDTDNDGIGNNGDTDDDGDLVLDNEDAFPLDPAASVDSDGDGYPDGWNSGASESEIAASGLVVDQMPNDSTEQIDTDGDGIGNNADTDDDGDGVADNDDIAPLDSTRAGFFVSGRVIVDGEMVVDSDTNSASNVFEKNNTEGVTTPDPTNAQFLNPSSRVHGHVNKSGAGAFGQTYEAGDEDDFFLINGLSGQTFTLLIGDHTQGDLDFALWNQDAQIIAISEGVGPQEAFVVPEDGVYYLNVYAWSGASNYTIEADFESQLSAKPSMRFGEAIVSYKSKIDGSKSIPSQYIELYERNSVLPQGRILNGVQLVKTRDDAKTLSLRSDDPKFNYLATQSLREYSLTQHFIKSLLADPEIERVQPNFLYFSHSLTNDPLLADMWHLDQISVPEAWGTTSGDPGVVVAVIDSGVLSEHPDISDKSSIGYDFISWSNNSDGDGIDPDPEDPMPLEDRCDGGTFYHGTHVAGTAGAIGNNDEGIVGVAYDVSLMHLRALDGSCGGTTYDIAQSVLYAIGADNDSGESPDNPADIINMSLGGGSRDEYFEAVLDEAAERGVIVVGSSGNSGDSSVGFPARYHSVVAVGATNREGEVTGYSNRGPSLALVAPGGGAGGGVWSLHKDETGYSYVEGQGTSMAAPHVAGVFALMKSVHPELSASRLNTLIEFELITDSLGAAGFDTKSGWGLINTQKALEVASADANGTLRLPAKMALSASQLYMPSNVTEVSVSMTNPGEIPLTVTGVTLGVEPAPVWTQSVVITEESNSDIGVDEAFVGAWNISIDRSQLSGGFYAAPIIFSGVDEEGSQLSSSLRLIVKVPRDGLGDVGAVHLILFNETSPAGSIEAVWSDIANRSDNYDFRLGVEEAGQYSIQGISDVDGDAEASDFATCGSGDYCGASAPMQLTEPQSDLEVTVDGPN
ncbi:S8 family serine peptidase [Luminiphilus sp.]|nr:S8 family serine peptidase [Luminiphilus sp.]